MSRYAAGYPNIAGSYYNSSKPLIDAFSDDTTFTIQSGAFAGSTKETLTGQGPNGEDVVRLNVAGAGNLQINKSVTVPAFGWIGQWVRVSDSAMIDQLAYFLFQGGNYWQIFPVLNTTAQFLAMQNQQWVFVQFPIRAMNIGGGAPVERTALTSIRVGINASNGAGWCDLGPMVYGQTQSRSVVMFSFDDNNDTDYTEAFPYLAGKGFAGTAYVIRSQVGAVNKTTVAQYLEMQTAGWTIGTHGATNLTTLTDAQITTELEEAKAWMLANGFTGWEHYSYPEGGLNAWAVTELRRLGFKTARTINSIDMPINSFAEMFQLNGSGTSAYMNDTTNVLATGTNKILAAIPYGNTFEAWAHRLQTTASAASGHSIIATWKLLVDYVANLGYEGRVDVLSKGQWYTNCINGVSRAAI